MKHLFSKKSNSGGVYRILCLENSREYVGSTFRFKDRFYTHKKDLLSNKHHCIFLQRDWNKLGPEKFIFEAIEEIEDNDKTLAKDLRIDLEQKTIDEVIKNKGRNSLYNSHTNVRDFRVTERTDQYKERKSLEMKSYYEKNPEKKVLAKENARKFWNEVLKDREDIIITHMETGEIETIKGSARQFCLLKELSYKSFSQMLNGKTKTCGGWFLGTEKPEFVVRKGEERKSMSQEQKETRADVSREGLVIENYITKETIVLGKNIKDSCSIERGLDYKALRRLLLDETLFTQSGWFKKSSEATVRKEIVGQCMKCKIVFGSNSGIRNHKRKCK